MNNKAYVRYIAFYGVLVSLAMIFSFIETLIPITLWVTGMKLGLANLVIIVSLYILGKKSAIIISIIRIVLVAFTFGNLSNMLFALAGGILSLICMIIAKESKAFSRVGVSMIGGVSHNIGQIIMAIFVVKSMSVISYLPILLITGIVTGIIIGILADMVIKRLSSIQL